MSVHNTKFEHEEEGHTPLQPEDEEEVIDEEWEAGGPGEESAHDHLGVDVEEVALPSMSHQSLRNATAAGFGEIFNTTTQPIYSVMDLRKLVSTVGAGGEMPPLISTRSSVESNKVLEFERIYGKLRKSRQSEDRVSKDKKRDGKPATPSDTSAEQGTQSNFLKTIVKTCLYRLLLVGTHKEDQDKLIEWMKDAIEDINVHCYSETLTGCFLIYPNHFVHVLEGSEDTLMKYMKVIADQFEPTGFDWKLIYKAGNGVSVRNPIIFTTVKPFVVGMFQIKHRGILNGWRAERAGSGLTMTQSEVPRGDYRERLYQFTKQCIVMALALSKLNPLRYGGDSKMSMTSIKSVASVTQGNSQMLPGFNPIPGIISSRDIVDEEALRFEEQTKKRAASIAHIVPKPPMIDYIVKKNPKRKIQLRSVREHINYFWKIPSVIFSQETDWPIPGKIAPYD